MRIRLQSSFPGFGRHVGRAVKAVLYVRLRVSDCETTLAGKLQRGAWARGRGLIKEAVETAHT
jgi:hypothetical protein